MQNRSKDHHDAVFRCEKLYRIYYRPLKRAAFQFMHDVHLSEDAVQQTFMRILKYSACLNRIPEGHEWGYLKTTLSNACIQMLRQREGTVYLEDMAAGTPARIRQCHMSAENEVMKALCIRDDLRELPECYARPLILHYLEDYSYEEIAGMDHANPATIRKRSQRGRKMLAKRLER